MSEMNYSGSYKVISKLTSAEGNTVKIAQYQKKPFSFPAYIKHQDF